MTTSYIRIILVLCITLAFTGCTSSNSKVKVMDNAGGNNPYYICQNADRHLENEDITEAEELYNKALGLEKDYPRALIGLARINTLLAEPETAVALCHKAARSSGTREESLLALTQLMTVYYTLKPDNWFAHVKDTWQDIEAGYEKPEAAALIMGKSYLAKEKALEATVCFRQVLDWDGEMTQEADSLLDGIYQRLRVEPGTHAGKKISGQMQVARADLAALLVEELKIIDYMEASAPGAKASGFQTPEEFKASKKEMAYPEDLPGHAYENNVKLILAYGFRGLTPFPGNLFKPEEPVSRAGFSMVVEDILSRIQDTPGLKNEVVGNASPFPDVARDHYALNAITVCTTRSFVAADLDGAFRPEDPITGVEALLAVRRLKDEIKSHQITY